jgi:hypothetical protein
VSWTTGQWARGVVDWVEGDTAYISVVFSWDTDQAFVLSHVQRWTNRRHWRKTPFSQYRASAKTKRDAGRDRSSPLFGR